MLPGDKSTLALDSVTLEKMRFGAIQAITKEQLALGAMAFQIEPEVLVEREAEGLYIRLTQDVLGKDLEGSNTVRYPADWWQHWKEQKAPRWFRRRWPVRWREVSIVDLKALYPQIPLPRNEWKERLYFQRLEKVSAERVDD